MSAYKIEVSVTPLCPSCGKECQSGSFMTESRAHEGIFDRDNPYERTDRRVFIGPCTGCFVFRGDVAELIEADEAFDLAYVDWAAEETDPLPLRDAFVAAKDRRRAALARVKGGAA